MSTVYVAVYLAASPEDLADRHAATAAAAAFVQAVRRGDWLYDAGDDPAFFCARHFGTPVTWGICRQDLRGSLEPGDSVVFIAHRRRPGGAVDYHWVGFATVTEKIRQAAIWEDQGYAIFRRYLNLLIRPDGDGGYRHQETHPGRAHDDWLWRLTRRKGHHWEKADFAAYEGLTGRPRVVPGRDHAANGEPIELAANYVIFSTDDAETVVLADPPLVAEHWPEWGPQRPERWAETPAAQGLHDLTLGLTDGRTLRLTTPDPNKTRMQQRHRHVRIANVADGAAGWRKDANALVRDISLGAPRARPQDGRSGLPNGRGRGAPGSGVSPRRRASWGPWAGLGGRRAEGGAHGICRLSAARRPPAVDPLAETTEGGRDRRPMDHAVCFSMPPPLPMTAPEAKDAGMVSIP